MSFCVITHPIGQNGRAVCKKHCNHGDARARGAKRRALGAAGRPAIDRELSSSTRVRTSTALGSAGPRPRLACSIAITSYSLASLAIISRSCAGTSIDAGLSGVRTSSLYSQARPTKVSDFSHIYASCKARLKRRVNCSLSYRYYSIHASSGSRQVSIVSVETPFGAR